MIPAMKSVDAPAKLTVSEAGRPAITIAIGDRFTIGRSPTNDLVLEDQNASRRHAEILRDRRGTYFLIDSGSANGTWLNARRLTAPRELSDGDLIAIGSATFRFSGPAVDRSAEPGAGTGA